MADTQQRTARKHLYVSMETIEKICKKLDCTVGEMMEFTDGE